MTTSMQLVPFHGDALTYVERDGASYVALKPISDRFGLAWQPQHRKLLSDPTRWGITILMIPSAGGEQETTCIPVSRIAGWLFSIHANKVKPELREALRLYQTEAADVLDRHFRLKRDADAVEISNLRARLHHCHAHLLAALPKWGKIKHLLEAGAWWPMIGKRTNMAQSLLQDEQAAMQDCGLLTAGAWDDGRPQSSLDRIRELEADLKVARMKAAAQAADAIAGV